MRGFRRVNPAAPPSHPKPTEAQLPSRPASKPTSRPPTAGASSSNSSRPENSPTGSEFSSSSAVFEQSAKSDNYFSDKYCHHYVNQGKCNYEENTGQKCKFLHKIAPMCNYGLSCSRTKCMFSHPKVSGSKPFLGNPQNISPLMNPWSMINPWMTQQPTPFHSGPWNIQGNRNMQ